MQFISNQGGGVPVDFEQAILDGFAEDGGLYVPTFLPKISATQLVEWKELSYVDLAFEILSLFIDRTIISAVELKKLLQEAYAPFEKEAIIPIHPLPTKKERYVMELFYGPTISFKDIGLAFLVNLVNFFLERKNEYMTLVVATTGDTGPAAAHFAAGKSNVDIWVLYPQGMITESQERQMTTLPHPNVHPVSVANCADGCDDLDLVIAGLYAEERFKKKLNLSSVNSINWGRVMMQTVHYFYGYLQVAESIGDPVHMAVPSGAFGNLCSGALARKMGLPVTTFIVANNQNACLHRIFSEGVFSKQPIFETPSSAIDILIPYNFWRYLFFCVDGNAAQVKAFRDKFMAEGLVSFDEDTFAAYSEGFLSYSASDEETLSVIKEIYEADNYLLDPHGAVAVAAVNALEEKLPEGKIICLATAHPSKFPEIMQKALNTEQLPTSAKHHSIEKAKNACQKVHLCDQKYLKKALMEAMENHWDLTKEIDKSK